MTYEELSFEWDHNDVIKCHTSGSTGTPKDILLTKEQMTRSALRTVDYFGLDRNSLLYSCISPDYIGGKMMLARQRVLECRLKWEKPSNLPLAGYHGDGIDLLSIVPSQMIYILDNLDDMPDIKNIIVGGSAIPTSLRHRIAESGLSAYESYGMTETASHIALRRIESDIKPFHTLGDITVRKNKDALEINIPDWKSIVTNDACEIISPHEFLISGRLDNIIISGGRKINPEKVEEILSQWISVPFFISSIPDEKWGQRLVIVIEGEEAKSEVIADACSKITDGAMRPKQIIIKEHLDRTPNGKIIRDFSC